MTKLSEIEPFISITTGIAIIDADQITVEYLKWLIKKKIDPVGKPVIINIYGLKEDIKGKLLKEDIIIGKIIGYEKINKKQIRLKLKLMKFIIE